MPVLDNGSSGLPQAHTQSYKRFATVVKKWGKHWNAISAPNVAVWHVPCNKTSEQVTAGRCQHHQSAGLSAKTPRSWTPVGQEDKGLQLSDCLLLKATHTMRAPWPASLREMPWGSAIMGHVHTPSVVSVHKTSWLTFMKVTYRMQNKEQWLLVSSSMRKHGDSDKTTMCLILIGSSIGSSVISYHWAILYIRDPAKFWTWKNKSDKIW